jgi:hypothetical protein
MKKLVHLFIFIISVFWIFTLASCGDDKNPLDATGQKKLIKIGSFNGNAGEIREVLVNGNYAYLADWDNGLHIVDISNKTKPAEKLIYDANKRITGVYGYDNYLFVDGIEINYIEILNITSPLNPVNIANIDSIGWVYDIVVQDTLLFIAAGAEGLLVYSISDINHPQFISSFRKDFSCRIIGLDITGQTAFLADDFFAMRIIDLSIADTLQEIIKIPTSESVYDICVENYRAYLACGDLGVLIYNAQNPVQPELIGFYSDDTTFTYSVEIRDNLVYASDLNKSLYILDVSNPDSCKKIASFVTNSGVYGFYVDGDYIYVAAGTDGMYILEYN